MPTPHPLDNPIWESLTSGHRTLAVAHGLAARYPADISPLAGLREPSEQAFADLRRVVDVGERVALFTTAPIEVPDDWRVLRARYIDQMICEAALLPAGEEPMRLHDADVPEMLALTALTEPGPFATRTIEMGRYYGVRSPTGSLSAMSGERLFPGAFQEISAVCTAPEARGQGLAQRLVAYLVAQTFAEGKTPFLHVKTENGAKVLYERLGFRVRCPIQYTVLTRR
ncbi:MAG: GNAT family N-acetyltransferase [Gemmatimonadales bacterium]